MSVLLSIPSADPTRLGQQERAAVDAAIAGVVASGPWIGGENVERFEEEFGGYVGGTAIGVANGTDAIAIALAALELPDRSRVLIAANEGGYAATAARQVGLEPLPMDIDEVTGAPTLATVRAAMRDGISAVVVTHLHGNAVDLTELDQWRRAQGLALIEDCAQAVGLRVDGRHVGIVGDAAAFSFYPTKNLGAIGDGGAIVFTDRDTADRARSIAQYGWSERFLIARAGGRNSRLDSLQAAILSARLPFVDQRNATRRSILDRYRLALGSSARLLGQQGAGVAHHAVVLTEDRRSLVSALDSAGIHTAVHYPYLLGEMPGLQLTDPAPTPIAASQRERMFSLPCFPELTPEEIEAVLAVLARWADDPR